MQSIGVCYETLQQINESYDFFYSLPHHDISGGQACISGVKRHVSLSGHDQHREKQHLSKIYNQHSEVTDRQSQIGKNLGGPEKGR